jgi:hypothetical protein
MTTRLIIHRREPTGHVFEQKAGAIRRAMNCGAAPRADAAPGRCLGRPPTARRDVLRHGPAFLIRDHDNDATFGAPSGRVAATRGIILEREGRLPTVGDELAITLPPEAIYLFDPESGRTLALRDQTPLASPRRAEPALVSPAP